MPEVRLNENYFSDEVDGIYQQHAGVIENYHFDRVKFRIPESTYRATDISHWLALDVATQSLADAGIPMKEMVAASERQHQEEMQRQNMNDMEQRYDE